LGMVGKGAENGFVKHVVAAAQADNRVSRPFLAHDEFCARFL
jgi:hypothetical protein